MSYCLNPACPKPSTNLAGSKFCQNCGSKLLLKDRYRAIKIIGQGGFGRTFLSVDEDKPSKPRCVIKQFYPQAQGTDNALKASELFDQEAVRLDELGKHPQIPELLAHFTQDNRQYLVQQFIDGENLAQVLETEGAFNETQIRDLLNNLLPVMEFIHSHNVIHRDIKPENIIQRSRLSNNLLQDLVLVDFGAAKFVNRTTTSVMGTVIGSAGYSAPEQAIGRAIFASDIYSLGVTCLHLLTQVEPFDLFDTSEGDWVWRDYLKFSVSDRLGQILDQMVQGATKKRYQSAAEIIADLHSNVSTPRGNFRPPVIPNSVVNSDFRSHRNWHCLHILTGHSNGVTSLDISASGQIASSSLDGTIKIWDLDNGQLISTFTDNSQPILSIAISPDQQVIAAGCEDGRIRVWNLNTGKLNLTLGKYWNFKHFARVNAIAFSSNGELASGSADTNIKLWNLYTGQGKKPNLVGDLGAITSLIYGPNNLLIIGSQDTHIRIRSIGVGSKLVALGVGLGLATSGVGSLAVIVGRKLTKPELLGHFGGITALAISQNGEILVSGSIDKTIKVWDFNKRSLLRTIVGHLGAVNSVAISPDGQTIISGSADKTIKLWMINTGEEICTITGHSGAVNSVAISPNGRQIISGSQDGTIKIWQAFDE